MSHDDQEDRLWEQEVARLLDVTPLMKGEFLGSEQGVPVLMRPHRFGRFGRSQIVDRSRRFLECSLYWIYRAHDSVLAKCVCGRDCTWHSGRFLQVCNLRGHFRCAKGLRIRLMRQYLPKLQGFAFTELRHVVFTYARVPSAVSAKESDFVLDRAMLFCRSMFRGALLSLELKEKLGGEEYVHVHGIVVRRPGTTFDYTVLDAGWRQLANSQLWFTGDRKFGGSTKKMLWYMAGYVLKGVRSRGDPDSYQMSPQEYVDFLRRFQGKRLVRAVGCLYGGRKGPVGETRRADSSDAEARRGAASTDSLGNDSIKSQSLLVCPECFCSVTFVTELVSASLVVVSTVVESETPISEASTVGGSSEVLVSDASPDRWEADSWT